MSFEGDKGQEFAMETKKSTAKMRHCFNCGVELGLYEDKHYDKLDTCGHPTCERKVREMLRAEQDEAHEKLDRF